MAGIDVGSESGKRAVQRDLPLVPFIDFLLCILAFLLVTAVWSEMARLEADALVPGDPTERKAEPAGRTLHVEYEGDARVALVWRQGATVVATDVVQLSPAPPSGAVSFSELAQAIARSWKTHGAHRSASDPERDRAVVHAPNTVPFEHVVAVMDAVAATKREPRSEGLPVQPAFQVAFATD